ncbi:hypothetical protein EW146_g6400 [Bondarzewia mesenterica]|uniref:Palmitoyltransferase n=1 Tax=Bondarzewia mesenterica TaxID=1095465 RepID=A0A4S4LNM4_9AGAM|nr:hypothetical protein EW146_g6400 [Bondarzewia mesenterica]
MAAQHSLPYSPSVPIASPTNRPSQLPSSLSSVGISTRFDSPASLNRLRSGSTSTQTPRANHSRSGSNISSASRPRPSLPISPIAPSSPTRKSFTMASASSSTHAGGILPPASFFRPSRPNQSPISSNFVGTRPPSVDSSHGIISPQEAQSLSLGLHPLSQEIVYDSDASTSMYTEPTATANGDTSRTSTSEDPSRQLPMKNAKFSREPLLPIGVPGLNRAASSATDRSRPSVSRGQTERTVGRTTAGARVLDSIGKLGISLESVRRSLSLAGSPVGSPSTNGNALQSMEALSPASHSHGGTTLEIKPYDDESMTRYKRSTSPSIHLRRSPSTSFIPHPPNDMKVPLSAVPRVDPKTKRPIRNYQLHPSRNRFFIRGRLLTGGDSPWAFIGSFMLVLGIAGTWFGTTCVWWWHNESPAVAAVGAYMCLLTISTMLTTAFRDPGILPRNLDIDPPHSSATASDQTPIVLPRDLKVRAGIVRVKYCPTCQTYRSPRSSHLRHCVDGCDHHCQWVNNCVGRRNYTYFFAFIFSATLTLCLVIVTSALHLYLITRKEHTNFRHAVNEGAGSAVAFCLSIIVIWPVAALLSYHMRLLILNVTTIEQIRNQAHKSLGQGPAPPNPFAHGSWRRNLAHLLCRPVGYSWVQPSAVATEDKREINPGLLDGGWEEHDIDLEAGHGPGSRES